MTDFDKYAFSMRIKVRDYEVDAEGIVNNAEYLHYMEHTRHEFCDMAGMPFSRMQQLGIDPVVTHIEIDYLRSLGLGEEMISCINLKRKGPLFIFYQDIFKNDGTQVTRATVHIASLREGKLTRGEELAEAFAEYL